MTDDDVHEELSRGERHTTRQKQAAVQTLTEQVDGVQAAQDTVREGERQGDDEDAA